MKAFKNHYLEKLSRRKALRFVILLGCVSFFADMTYESARSINGQYLQSLGCSASTIGWVAGIGELLGYGLRLFSGYLADKTKKYWLVAFTGYFLNLLSVPALALAGMWQVAVALMIMERVGKAIRNPARDAMLSYGAHEMGAGWGFGFHEAMDSAGATLGPVLLAIVLVYKNNAYSEAYLALIVPAVIALSILFFASRKYPNPEELELTANTSHIHEWKYPKSFWIYMAGVALIGAGYADFPLIAYHFKQVHLLKDRSIPLYYALAMAVEAVFSLILGKLYDRFGKWSIRAAIIISLWFAPLVFFGNQVAALIGMSAWGLGMAAQESVIKAEVSRIVPPAKRGSAFGIFNTAFGVFWFLGSVIMGYLYDFNILWLVLFSVVCQFIALFLI